MVSQDLLRNLFSPLFEVTLHPESNRPLHTFLDALVGFDSVDDESVPEAYHPAYPTPDAWTHGENPPYW